MVAGIRVSVGLALTGALFSSLGQALTGTASEPVALIGGSALARVAAADGPGSHKLVWQVAARADEGLRQPGPVSGAQLPAPPSVSRVEVDTDGTVRFQGRGTPGTRVTLNRQGNAIGSTLVSSGGDWELTLAGAVSAGEHLFGAEASLDGNRVEGADVRIAIPGDYLTGAGAAADGGDGRDSVRRRAEDLARDASERFTEIERERLAQAQQPQPQRAPQQPADPKTGAAGEPAPEGGIVFRLQDWLARANRDFQGEVVRRLQTPPPDGAPGGIASPKETVDPAAAAKAQAEERARAERIAQERKAAELRRQEQERRAAAVADARDREAARQAEVQSNAEAEARRNAEAARSPAPQAGPDRSAEADRRRAEAEAVEREKAARDRAAAEEAARQRAAGAEAERRRAAAAEAERLRKMVEESADDAMRAARARQEHDARERALLEAELAEKARRAEERARQRVAEERSRIARKAERGDQLKTITRESITIGKDARPAGTTTAEPPAPVRRAAPDPSTTTTPAPPAVQRAVEPAAAPRGTQRDTIAQVPPRTRLRGGDGTGDDPAAAASRDTHGDVQRDAQADARERTAPRRDVARPDGAIGLGQRAPASRSSEAPAAVAGHRTRATSADCRYAGRRVKPPATYVVRRGDSLWRISARHYRRGHHWPVIYRANDAKIDDPDLIFPCQRFFLPSLRRR